MEQQQASEKAPDSIRASIPEELRDFFENPSTVHAVIRGQASDKIRGISNSFSERIDTSNLEASLGWLMRAAATDEVSWQQDERDATNVIVKQFALNASTALSTDAKLNLINSYAHTVRKLPKDADYFGAPHSLYEMGETICQIAGNAHNEAQAYQARMNVRDAWNGFFPNITDSTERDTAKGLVEDLVKRVLPRADETPRETWEWNREKPTMERDTARVHDFYLEKVRSSGSFKEYTYEASPEFRARLADKGLRLEDVWNTHDPDKMAQGITTLVTEPSLQAIAARFDIELQNKYKLRLADMQARPELARIMADQIAQIMQPIKQDIARNIKVPEEVYQRLVQQVDGADTARNATRKLKPIQKFLELAGVQIGSTADVRTAFESEQTHQQVIAYLQAKQEQKSAELAALEEAFPESPYPHLQFMNRDEQDLYAADETRDCTAYHLKNGFNGYTVAHWLANPGFVMAYLTDGTSRFAKLGLLLAEDENGPRLVIDSIEAHKDINDPETAMIHILSGLMELQDWADERGLGEVFFCTYTNSSELSMELPVRPATSQVDELRVFGSDVGLQEVWQSISQSDKYFSLGYLQSHAYSEDGEDLDFHETPGTDDRLREEAIYRLELLLVRANSPEITEAARAGDWGGVVTAYIKKMMPNTYKLFGNNVELYTKSAESRTDNRLLYEAMMQRQEYVITDEVLSGIIPISKALTYESSNRSESIAIHDLDVLKSAHAIAQIHAESERFNIFLDHIATLRDHTTIDAALRQIYGNQQLGEQGRASALTLAEREVSLSTKLQVISDIREMKTTG